MSGSEPDAGILAVNGPYKWTAIAAGALILSVDGFDIICVSVAAPGIGLEWGLDSAQIGWILATEVMGAAIGATVFGRSADILGRRTIILMCLALTAIGMAVTSLATDPLALAFIRLATGIGLGGLNPAVTSMVSEVASESRRDQSVAVLGLGYATGAIIGGATATLLLSSESWRAIFLTGAIVTGFAFLAAIPFVPETLPKAKRERETASTTGRPVVQAEGTIYMPSPQKAPYSHSSRSGKNSALLTLVSIGQLSTFYFSVKWLPKLAVDAGMSAAAGASALTSFNIGGLVGMLAMAPLARILGLKTFTMAAFVSSGFGSVLLAITLGHHAATLAAAFFAGLLANAAFGGLYACVARSFPRELRSTGIGLTLGIGRAGAALAPVMTGLLFNSGATFLAVAFLMTVISIGAATILALVPFEH